MVRMTFLEAFWCPPQRTAQLHVVHFPLLATEGRDEIDFLDLAILVMPRDLVLRRSCYIVFGRTPGLLSLLTDCRGKAVSLGLRWWPSQVHEGNGSVLCEGLQCL